MSEQKYRELHPGEIIQPGDEFCVSIGQDRWHPYPTRRDGSLVSANSLARRPIVKAAKQPQSQPIAYEEVPGSRTTQDTVVRPQRERIAYEELQPGDVIQSGDEWQNDDGRWHPLVLMAGGCTQVRDGLRARRPYNITQMENDRAEAIAEVAKLSAELWARKPLEDRIASLMEELAQAREGSQQLLKTITDNADQFVWANKTLEQQRDEARAERDKLKGLIDDLLDEPTAKQVQNMLRTWATELDWSAGCFGSFGRSQIDIIQQTMVAVIQRIETMVNPEGGTDGE